MIRTFLATASVAALAIAAPAAAHEGDAPDGIEMLLQDAGAGEGETATPTMSFGEWGVDTSLLSDTIDPGDDFFAYVNQKWLDANPLPPEYSRFGAFNLLREKSTSDVNTLVDSLLKKPAAQLTSDEKRIVDAYNSYFDTDAINAAGLAPAQPYLDKIRDAGTLAELATLWGTPGYSSPMGGGVSVDSKEPTRYSVYVGSGGLGLPEREYYLSSDAKLAGLRGDYQTYIANLLKAANIDDADAKAKRIYDLEMKIAKAHVSRGDSDDWATASSLWSKKDFEAKAPGMDWDSFFKAAQLDGFKTFDAYHPSAITGLSKLVESEPLEAWKDWLVFHQINANTAVLPTKLDQMSFDFYGKTLSGTEQQRPRDKRALAAVNTYMGDALGKLYVEKYFPASAKAEIKGMTDNIKDAFAKRIDAVDWMAADTKAEAKKKVETMEVGVGYPDEWTDYDSLTIKEGDAYADVQAAEKLRYRQQLAKVGKPLDKGEWWMNAQLVNAVNLPVQNALNFPAAILQPPFFDPKADPAYNYGAIGAVIGHEISHSFDNNGAEFDSTGAMRDWWTDADRKKFEEAGKALADQYDTYEPFPGLNVKGELTLGENIADLAGLQAAYDAYHASLGGKEAPVIDGFTGDQRFFIAYAQTWATKMREEALRQRIATDGHAPGQYRALTVRNMDAWYKAFDVKEGDKLYLAPDKRVKIW